MSGALLAALFAAVLVINLAITLAIVRGDVDLDQVVGPTHGRTDADNKTGFAAITSAREADTSEGDDRPPSLKTSEGTVSGQAGGATNRAGYRYCRWGVQPALGSEGGGPGQGAATTQRPL